MSNRILTMCNTVETRVKELTPEVYSELEKNMAIDFVEHFAFQNLQAQAHASGRITTDEAQTIYSALGEVGSDNNGGWAANTSLSMKVTVTKLMGELIGAS